MNKNIYIVGVPRSGKTTLAKMIKNKYKYLNILSFEAIRNGFIKSQPTLNMESKHSLSRKEILPSFVFEFIKWNYKITCCGSIIEGDFTNIETIVNNNNENDKIICLGFSGRTLDEIVNFIMKNDTENDYTKNWNKEKLKKHFEDIQKMDLKYMEQCRKHNIDYYDTFNDRNKALQNITKEVEK